MAQGKASSKQPCIDTKDIVCCAFRRLFVAATRASQSRATAASILQMEKEEMRRRGARVVDEDPIVR